MLRALIPQAPTGLCAMLDAHRGIVQLPIGSAIFGAERFAQHGRSLAATHRATRAPLFGSTFFPRLQTNIATLREARQYIGLQASTGYDISPAAEWLLDNFHTIEAQLKEIHDGLPLSYFRKLPMLVEPPLAGLPRIYGVAWAFVAHTDGAFDEDLLLHFLNAYQDVRELTLGEMWALPTTLRVVLVENLRRLAERVATNKAAREVANLCFDRIDSYSVDALDDLFAQLSQRGVGRVFLGQMAQRMQDRKATGDGVDQLAVTTWLTRVLPDVAALQTQQSADQAADNLSVSNAVTALRAIGDADWTDIIARTSSLMRLMLTSPLFAAEDGATRDQTLHAIERLTERVGKQVRHPSDTSAGPDAASEVAVARVLLLHMQAGDAPSPNGAVAHHWLAGSGRPALLRSLGLGEGLGLSRKWLAQHVAFAAYIALSVGLVGLWVYGLMRPAAGSQGLPAVWWWLSAALMLFPASEAVVAVMNRLIGESVAPQHLPRLSLVEGIPPSHRVLVVIPAMLTHVRSGAELAHRLELHYLANPEAQAQFALLTDWADAPSAHQETDVALLDSARAHIAALNARYAAPTPAAGLGAPRFVLLHRPRLWCETQQCWMGWERKRGKLEQLIACLAVQPLAESAGAALLGAPFLDLGVHSQLALGIQHLLTLDSDTELPPGTLRELVGVAAHPHNRPVLDASGKTVVHGYAILQPRIAMPLPTPSDATPYHWLFAGQCGTDAYSVASSEVYQDLFQEGSFTGKGLLHVQACHAVLGGRLPTDLILSHDLLEGSIARCAAVSDIAVMEDAPFHADVASARQHRWMRGDWQLLPVLWAALVAPARYRIRAVNVWKMGDNLRRSLVAPLALAWLVLALSGRSVAPLLALGVVVAAFSAGPLMGALASFVPGRKNLARRYFYRLAGVDLARALCGGAWHVAQLLSNALLALDAVARTLYRMVYSHRHLLQWTTTQLTQSQAQTHFVGVLRGHRREPVAAAVLWTLLLLTGTPYLWLSTLVCLLWACAPVLTWWVSRCRSAGPDQSVPASEQQYLHDVARDTWRLFERCVTAAEHYLPPDNLQCSPHDMVAHRTSPTNIGLYLLSAACARQFGWIGREDFVCRLEATLGTLQSMQRHRGHFLNWYDTQTAQALLPMYVSTVDSGNLSGHLLAVAQACLALARSPAEPNAGAMALQACRTRLNPLLAKRKGLSAASRAQLRWQLADYRATRLSFAMDTPASSLRATDRLHALARTLTTLACEADYGFLYHRKRHLLHIGYRVAEQQLDAGFYDLLASESRLTSVLAIAKGDVPVRHWASLGRLFFAEGTQVGLRSWTGSMFEYLMPTLVLTEPQGSVLHEACEAALNEQMAFARSQGVPWGISESAYGASDYTLAYQYAPQGVPRLALRRTPPDELVVAPYATALAAQIAPRRAVANLMALEALGSRGRYGFADALDYTPTRRVGGEAFALVDTYMAHHQGMTIVALANVLLDGVAQRWGMANAAIEAVASLLHERVPREVPLLYSQPLGLAQLMRQRRRVAGLQRAVPPTQSAVLPTHLLSNGRYSVALRANGAGWSRFGGVGLTRERDELLRDDRGSFFYVRWDQQPMAVSLTQHPAPDPHAKYRSAYHADRVCFEASWASLQTTTTVWVSPEDDIEFRQVDLRNPSARTLDVELISAFEVSMAPRAADESHPAFTNMFVRAHWLASQSALVFERTPRLETEPRVHMAHFLTTTDPRIVGVRLQTDRQRWLGRNHGMDRPLASFERLAADDLTLPAVVLDTGLDPMCALALQLRLPAGDSMTLTFATCAADNEGTLRSVVDKYRQASHVKRASLMSATLAGIRLRALRISPDNYAAMQTLSTALNLSVTRPTAVLPSGGPASKAEAVLAEVCDRRLLWRHGISGDRPILLVSAGVMQGLGLLRSLAQALNLWAWAGVACDVVVVNAEPMSYLMGLQRELMALRERHDAQSRANVEAPGAQVRSVVTGLHVLRADEVSAAELSTLQALARIRLHADGRPLTHHVQEWLALHTQALEARTMVNSTALVTLRAAATLPAPTGQFDHDTGEFRFAVGSTVRPVRPWINVLANPQFGCHISESGGGYTWAHNSRLNQLTAWSNDPVADLPSECWWVQDRKTQEVWSLVPNAWSDSRAVYQVAHGQGSTTISHRHGDWEFTLCWCVDTQSAVKHTTITLHNHGSRSAHLRLVAVTQWQMGASRADRGTVLTAMDDRQDAVHRFTTLLATQRECSAGLGGGTAFLSHVRSLNDPVYSRLQDAVDWTCDRRECFDVRGRMVLPDQWGQTQGLGLDPCAALGVNVHVAPGTQAQQVFVLGYAASPQAARALVVQAGTVAPAQRLNEVRGYWNHLLGATTVRTPDALFNALVNRWLLYQTVACRLWAKAGFYQAGGATGFRDQLQDAMALAWAAPEVLRQQIVVCAGRQFAQGDVQHWWHTPSGAGVRTHFSDDLLWLPYACVHYVRATGDTALWDTQVAFLDGLPVAPGAEDAYFEPTTSAEHASVYEHAARTLDRSLAVGAHGLPLMGTGDWNDGMNRVGIAGRGESVWLGWFLCQLVENMVPIARERGELARVQAWSQAALGWRAALLGTAWDGEWFKRAYFDDGQALGSHANAEASIDLIAQAWSVLSGVAPPAMQQQAMDAVQKHLVNSDAGLIQLLAPPLAHSEPSAGYIQAYPAGVRENGGQYSHAGVWAVMAAAALTVRAKEPAGPEGVASVLIAGNADPERAFRYFTYLSPAHRSHSLRWGGVYGLEPYAVAGDVYSQAPYVGRGGWSWYTGAAAWLHRAAVESIFGLQCSALVLCFKPCLPSHWPRADISLTREGRTLHFLLVQANPEHAMQAEPLATLLVPGQSLMWQAVGAHSKWVIPLQT